MPNLADIYTQHTRVRTEEEEKQEQQKLADTGKPIEDALHFQQRQAWLSSPITVERKQELINEIAALLEESIRLANLPDGLGKSDIVVMNLVRVKTLQEQLNKYGN